MTLPATDRTNLNNLSPNLAPNEVAASNLRLLVFQEIYAYLDSIIADGNTAQAAGAVSSAKLADGSVITVKLADSAVTGAKILNGAVITAKLADDSVTTLKLLDGNVTTAKLEDGAVTSVKMADGTISAAKLADAIISTTKLVDGSVTNIKLASGSVTSGKIANNAVGPQHLQTGLTAPMDVNAQFFKRGIDVTTAPYNAKGDGITDDAAAIQSALDAIKAIGGGKVFVPDGVFLIKSYLKIPSNTTLALAPNATLKRGSNTNLMITNDADGVTGGYDANHKIKIVGGTIDGNSSVFPTACTGVGFGHCTYVRVEGVTFLNVPIWHSLEFNAVKYGKCIDCTFDGNPGGTESLQIDGAFSSAAFPWFGPYDFTMCDHIDIEGCLFTNGVDGVGSHTADATHVHTFINITNCRFVNMTGIGVKPLNYNNVLIEGNIFEDIYRGIDVTKNTSATGIGGYRIVGNIFKNINKAVNGRAIYLTGIVDILVEANIINVVERHGMGFDYCRNVQVIGNNVQGCGQGGIWGFGSQKVQFINNISISNNTSASATRYDLMMGYVSNAVAEDCKAIGNHCNSLGIQYTDKMIISKNTILDTYIETTSTNVVKSENFIAGAYPGNFVMMPATSNNFEQEGYTIITLVSSGQTSITVNFPVAFSNIPDVFITLGGNARAFATASGTTSTSVTIYINNLDAPTPSITVRWLAKGKM